MIIGEVIGIFINNKFIKNNRVDSVSMRYIARMGYSEYTTVNSSKFNLKKKKKLILFSKIITLWTK